MTDTHTTTSELMHHAKKATSPLNKTLIEGFVGGDPKYRAGDTDSKKTAFSTFSIAVNETYQKAGERISKTTWIPVVCYGSLADIAKLYIEKGKRLLVDGKLSASTWTDKEGKTRTTLQIVASTFRFLDPKQDEEEEKASQSQTEQELS